MHTIVCQNLLLFTTRSVVDILGGCAEDVGLLVAASVADGAAVAGALLSLVAADPLPPDPAAVDDIFLFDSRSSDLLRLPIEADRGGSSHPPPSKLSLALYAKSAL